ncbi:MAG: thioredoxin family protein [Sphingopyxis sp.]|uniref:thioredoxin family protein n=1 Tax=Sphingopyxis sp. TaxID=1908224 RepID=UPI002ABC9D49|nr:thioredoxin family protein [Sphingopyxis sp.]MDZ3830723.1 thioredoxin family protein [Sphingopyxis sp.]
MRRLFSPLPLLIAAAAIAIPVTTAMLVRPVAAADAGVKSVPFRQESFDAARAAGKPILVDVHAPWCPVCARQQPGIAAAQRDRRNAGLIVFRLDFDNQKDAQRPLGVTRQSTLIAFRGRKETGRLLGVTDKAAIARLIASTRG